MRHGGYIIVMYDFVQNIQSNISKSLYFVIITIISTRGEEKKRGGGNPIHIQKEKNYIQNINVCL